MLLALTPLVASPFDGCISIPPPEAGTHADLGIRALNVTSVDGGYSINMSINVGFNGDWEPFRNVSVVVLDAQNNEICSYDIGTIDTPETGESVSFHCAEFPHTITYDITRDRCGPQTSVRNYVYDPEQELWVEQHVKCEET